MKSYVLHHSARAIAYRLYTMTTLGRWLPKTLRVEPLDARWRPPTLELEAVLTEGASNVLAWDVVLIEPSLVHIGVLRIDTVGVLRRTDQARGRCIKRSLAVDEGSLVDKLPDETTSRRESVGEADSVAYGSEWGT